MHQNCCCDLEDHIDRIEVKEPRSLALLRAAKFLAADPIPSRFISAHIATSPGNDKPLGEVDLGRAIRLAANYSMLKRDLTNVTVSMHVLVQEVIREQLKRAHPKEWKSIFENVFEGFAVSAVTQRKD